MEHRKRLESERCKRVDHCGMVRGCGKVGSCRMAENNNSSERYILQMEH